ncbi:MAG: hypothetical protein WCF12_15445, partial [Propionicimonas sp.]
SGPPERPGPATLLMDTDLRIQGSTPGMDDRLRRLLPHCVLLAARLGRILEACAAAQLKGGGRSG